MKFKFIKEHKNEFTVSRMCLLLGVNRSSYYAWMHRVESKRSKENKELTEKIKEIYYNNKCRYGSPKIREILNSEGKTYGHNRIARLMRKAGLKSIIVKRYRNKNISVIEHKACENVLDRKFTASEANRAWVTDITYIPTQKGWVYFCCFLDLYSRTVVGWSVDKSLKIQLVVEALTKACVKRKPNKGLLIHSDRGVQYGSDEYKTFLKRHNFIQSMSRKGNCWDNACIESFFSIIKREELNRYNFKNMEEVKYVIFKYIEIFYNTKRIHSYLGYRTPSEFEKAKIA